MEATEDQVNEVRLVGRISRRPEERTLPSGDTLWTFSLVVRRPRDEVEPGRLSVDTLDCSVWGGTVAQTVADWLAGDTVEVLGRLRRRFYRAGGSVASRTDVAVLTGRLVRREEQPAPAASR